MTILAPILAYVAALKAWALIQGVITIATQAWTAAQVILNAVMTANPIFRVIAAVAALVAGSSSSPTTGSAGSGRGSTPRSRGSSSRSTGCRTPRRRSSTGCVPTGRLLLAILTGPFGWLCSPSSATGTRSRRARTAVYNWVHGQVSQPPRVHPGDRVVVRGRRRGCGRGRRKVADRGGVGDVLVGDGQVLVTIT